MVKWCKGKTKEEIEEEMGRQIDTYNVNDLREMLFNALSYKEKKEWVDSWHDND